MHDQQMEYVVILQSRKDQELDGGKWRTYHVNNTIKCLDLQDALEIADRLNKTGVGPQRRADVCCVLHSQGPKPLRLTVPVNELRGLVDQFDMALQNFEADHNLSRKSKAGREVVAFDCPSRSESEPVKADAFVPLSGPKGVADNLKRLRNVSPAIEKKFNDLGVYHFWQIASFSEETARLMGEEVGLPGRMPEWLKQIHDILDYDEFTAAEAK